MARVADKVVVVTGASSGIGRATAVAFARQGAAVVLAARRDAALHDAAEECLDEGGAFGGRAMVVPTDVTDQRQMHHLASRAIEAFGRIDVWVNNAGIIAFGRFEETPDDVFEQVLRTNLMGTVNGCRAVLPHFLDRERGVIVNNASVVSTVGQRYASAYVASKFAVRGFSETLRQELVEEPGIQVCTVMPGSIDTPLWQHAANYTGRAVRPPGPVTAPVVVADAILSLSMAPQPELFVGGPGRFAELQHAMAPGLAEAAAARLLEHEMFENRPAPRTDGATLQPMGDRYDDSRGGWMAPPPPPEPKRSRVSWTNVALFLLPLGLMGRLPHGTHAR